MHLKSTFIDALAKISPNLQNPFKKIFGTNFEFERVSDTIGGLLDSSNSERKCFYLAVKHFLEALCLWYVCVHIILCLMELKYSKYYFLTYFHLGKVVLIAIDNKGKDQTSYFLVKRVKKMEIVMIAVGVH